MIPEKWPNAHHRLRPTGEKRSHPPSLPSVGCEHGLYWDLHANKARVAFCPRARTRVVSTGLQSDELWHLCGGEGQIPRLQDSKEA